MTSVKDDITTFVVIDLEVNKLSTYQFNHCGIMEICLYAISAKYLKDRDIIINRDNSVITIPELPRILHRLTIQINPRRRIGPKGEKLTGLTNEMLEFETHFDRDTAECINYYLARLPKPICLVAHNGWEHDFRVLRSTYEKINMIFPSYVYCVDSYKAFREIDEKHKEIEIDNSYEDEDEDDDDELLTTTDIIETESNYQTFINAEDRNDDTEYDIDELLRSIDYNIPTTSTDTMEQNSQINWENRNEETPHKSTNNTETRPDNQVFLDENKHINKTETEFNNQILNADDMNDEEDELLRSIEYIIPTTSTDTLEQNSQTNWQNRNEATSHGSTNEATSHGSTNNTETRPDNQIFLDEDKHKNINKTETEFNNQILNADENEILVSDTLEQNSQTNWQNRNEATPHRSINNTETRPNNKKFHTEDTNLNSTVNVRRKPFTDDFEPKKKYPRKGSYGLENIYKRCFKQKADKLHEAEGDVIALSKLILHYGLSFLAYAEERKVTFDKVPRVGENTN